MVLVCRSKSVWLNHEHTAPPEIMMNELDVGNVASFLKKENNRMIPKRLQINVITRKS